MKTIGISQEIPFPTKILLQKKIARREMESLEAEAKETELRVVRELKDAYVSFLVSDKKLDFAKANQAFLGQLAKAAESRYASGRAEQVEYLRAQVEEAKLIGQIGLLEQERIIAHELLASLLDREPGELGDIVVDETWDDVTVSDGQVLALVKSDRPELKSYEALLNKAQSEYSLGKESFLPDVTLKYKRAEGDGSFDRGEWAGSIGVNVPLWFWGKQLNEVREKRADLDAAKAEYAAAEQTAVFEGRSALAKARAARDVVKLYEGGILPRIESAAEVARRTYEAGTANFQEVFDAVQMSKEFQMEYVDALAAYLVAQADLEQAVGGHLPVKEAK
jgi:outer membrane protein TolC